MEQRKPNKADLKKIRTEIEPNLEEIKKTLEIEPETIEEIVRKSRELSALSIKDMTRPLRESGDHQCNAKRDCDSCPVELCRFPRLLMSAKPMPGRIHHPPLRIPQPNLIRKLGNEIDSEIMNQIWRNIKWKKTPGSKDMNQK